MDDLTHPKLFVTLNNSALLEFDRRKPVPGLQRRYLETMDQRMDQGIELEGQFIAKPDLLQRTYFVSETLYNALFDNNDTLAIAMCTWLAKRIPELKQLKAIGEDIENIKIELVFDRDFEQAQQDQTIQFYTPDEAPKPS